MVLYIPMYLVLVFMYLRSNVNARLKHRTVDPEMARRLLRLFVELNRLGATILMATHDLTLVNSLNAPVLELSEGRLVGKVRAA